MAIQTTTFKGARYLVKFHDPIEWASTESYEAIEAVQHNAFTYISKQPVPAGVQIDNTDFWLLWADPNAQMEELRRIVSQYVDDVRTLSGTVSGLSDSLNQEIKNRKVDIEKAHVFETVADMKQNANLSVGAICHTNGFHTSGDGGAAWYEIADTGTANEMDVIACGELFANLIIDNDYVTPEMFGAWGDGTHDDTLSFITAFKCGNSQLKCIPIKCIGNKIYKFDSEISIPNVADIDFDGNNATFKDMTILFNIVNYLSYEKFVHNSRVKFKNMNVVSDDTFRNEFFIKAGNPFIAENIITRNVPYFAVFSNDAYLDNLTIINCGSVVNDPTRNFRYDAFSTYATNGNITSNTNNGDSILFELCSFGGIDSDLNIQTIFNTENNNSFSYKSCTNGFISIGSNSTVLIESCQFEGNWNNDTQYGYGFNVVGTYSVAVICNNCRFDFNSRITNKFAYFTNCTFEAFRHGKKSFISYGFDLIDIDGKNNYIGFDNEGIYQANIKIPDNASQSQIHDTVSRIINFGTYAYSYANDYGYDVGTTYTIDVYPSLFKDKIAGCNHDEESVEFTPTLKTDYSLSIYNDNYADGIYLHAYLKNNVNSEIKKAVILVPNHNDATFIGNQTHIVIWHNKEQFGFSKWESVDSEPDSSEINKYAGYRYNNLIISATQQNEPVPFINIVS